ncbi:hypothetical protein [Bradyrhizobium sp. LA7.1]|uniref:hypothetical protein n=1 Tax=Bradyrhizobium sp. LA7.1 TaxID=3156324 RepID=UPI003394C92B
MQQQPERPMNRSRYARILIAKALRATGVRSEEAQRLAEAVRAPTPQQTPRPAAPKT